jgi:hypothetical protein
VVVLECSKEPRLLKTSPLIAPVLFECPWPTPTKGPLAWPWVKQTPSETTQNTKISSPQRSFLRWWRQNVRALKILKKSKMWRKKHPPESVRSVSAHSKCSYFCKLSPHSVTCVVLLRVCRAQNIEKFCCERRYVQRYSTLKVLLYRSNAARAKRALFFENVNF